MGEYTEKYKLLAERLSKIPQVTRYDTGEDKEAWTLAHALTDIEESVIKFEEYLGRLAQQNLNDKEVYDILLDIGEEFRHVLYHIKDPKFYRYLIPAEQDSK